ncbi:MAG TPA: ABC transporter permease [Actinomycetota bacterium]|nr:ABC transporter permease [Actinomycetota bacterium]
MTQVADTPAELVADKRGTFVRNRELLLNLIRKELKVKYKNSALGFLWSLMNPLLYLVVFSLVLVEFLRQQIPEYHFYLLSGLLAWNFFSQVLPATSRSIVDNSSLVTKVYFRREVLPLAAVGAGGVHFLLQFAVLYGAMLVFNHQHYWDAGMFLLPLSVVTLLLLLVGFGLILACINVYYRDVQHLLDIGLLAWFWLTPIVYSSTVATGRFWTFYLLNPMTPVVLGLQRALYSRVSFIQDGRTIPVLPDAPVVWYAERLGYVALMAIVVIGIGLWTFRRLDGRLAEEL